MSAGGQPQFRYTQPPSKVLHVRNLPWECSEEELVELCKPFGKIVNTKLNVGANHNQAFVEFGDLNQAIAMVSYYASSSEPAQVRGKAVYLQYSTRQEIVTTKASGDVASNVLLVTIEGVEAGDVTIDVLHLVFSAFGFVQKIATFEKSAGFQALVQYGDPETASEARTSLDGRSIPKYLLPEHVTSCILRISFSAHNDLNVRFQSHRSRDYTNPYLPVAPSATDTAGQQQKKEAESNVLLASIENMQYAVTIDVLHTVFSAFGFVQKIAIFEKTAGFQALIQYPEVTTAVAAKEALEGHCIYDGGFCKLRLSYSRHTDLNVKANNERSRDYTKPDLPAVAAISPPGGVLPSPILGGTQPQSTSPLFGAAPTPPAPSGSPILPPQAPPTSWDYEQAHAMAARGMPPSAPPPGAPPGQPPPGQLPSHGGPPPASPHAFFNRPGVGHPPPFSGPPPPGPHGPPLPGLHGPPGPHNGGGPPFGGRGGMGPPGIGGPPPPHHMGPPPPHFMRGPPPQHQNRGPPMQRPGPPGMGPPGSYGGY